MPTVFTHAAVPLAAGVAGGLRRVPGRLVAAGMLVSILPDADVLGFKLGIPYGHFLGHRGFLHSPAFALAVALTGALAYRRLRTTYGMAFMVLFVSMASHGLLDAATSGGLGIAFLSPFSNIRYFFPWQPIEVAPLSIHRFMMDRAAVVMLSELIWVWLPLAVPAVTGWVIRRVRSGLPTPGMNRTNGPRVSSPKGFK